MMNFRWLSLLVCIGAAVVQTPNIGSNHSGILGPLHLKLHLRVSASADA